MLRCLLFAILTCLFTSTHAQKVILEEIKNLIKEQSQTTSFPDSLYQKNDWDTFEELPISNAIIDWDNIDYGLMNAAIFYATNKYRKQKRREAFLFDHSLRDAAFLHSYLMVQQSFFGHINRKSSKFKTPDKRVELFSDERSATVGENITEVFLLNYTTGTNFRAGEENERLKYYVNDTELQKLTYWQIAKNAVQHWAKSKNHKKNMLNKNFSYLGCAGFIDFRTFNNKKEIPKIKATQVFGG